MLRQFGWINNILASPPRSTSAVETKDPTDSISYEMFDQSFVMSILTAWLITEWYLSTELLGMVAPPTIVKENHREILPSSVTAVHERRPLLQK